MSNDIQPFDPFERPNLGAIDRHRIGKQMKEIERQIIGAGLEAHAADTIDVLRHRGMINKQHRVAERTVNGIELAGAIYDHLVEASGGDPAKAQFLSGNAIIGRDAIARLI
ncbi:hypothetical protein [Cryobacterium sp. MDB2-33-2]|uniref:hypothetical protein n=1 Tax=Cryobacterium sp. MDB2-33-2 TaxID=1259179 RepID=UPI00106A6C8F|nr:hypothetical protein [Cryobacterium sp. MDB2-33-2]TFC05063.1 hypothetical protein E3O59_13065 [Cryobacterium sp. MDB2-33-2]